MKGSVQLLKKDYISKEKTSTKNFKMTEYANWTALPNEKLARAGMLCLKSQMLLTIQRFHIIINGHIHESMHQKRFRSHSLALD